MSKLQPINERLAKLLPLLGSDKDGEVANAARIITSLLASVGADWHDVVKALGPAYTPVNVPAQTSTDTGWRTSAAGNQWKRRDGYTVSVFRKRTGRYGICVAGPGGTKTFRDGYYSEDDTLDLADDVFEEMIDEL